MAYVTPKISATMNVPMQNLAPVTSYSGTVTNALNSSLFLSRMFVPAELIVTEIDAVLGINFAATSNGAGTISGSFGIYTFGNSTSLQLLTLRTNSTNTSTGYATFGSNSAWTTGTTTAVGSTSLSQFQGGWGGSLLQPMTLPTPFTLQPGEYVVGQMFNFAQASSTWSVSVFGLVGAQSTVTSGTASIVKNTGFLTASFFTNSTLTVSAFSQAGTTSSLILTASTAGTVTAWSASSIVSRISGSTATTTQTGSTSSTKTSTYTTSYGTATINSTGASTSGTAQETVSITVPYQSAPNTSSSGTGTVWSAAPTGAVIFSSGVLSSGLIFSGVSQVVAITNVGTNFGGVRWNYITGSNVSGNPSMFQHGILSIGSLPVSIALTTAAIRISGSAAMVQPWFALIGS